ncbi:putative serine/threonine-protein kinase kinX [Portunus trituberculatus]|uniref:Putative serine/threonine-protein kinase kinX n=1 Tax=Portunus trituberculatus TaxID=210409 RepID=A0A5B7FPU8_PORTR|nr:putative serine/threonine-protein kinase kinX [Portunus trituberculatus]
MYQCPEDLFPLHHEGSPRPNSSTTDPSSSPAPQPTPTTRRPGCAKTLQDEAEIQGPAAASAPAPTPTPILEIGMLYTHGTTQRTLTTMATLAGALDRVGEGGAAGDASPFRGPGTETAAAFRNHTTVRSSVALHQLELDLEPVSLHEPGCVEAAEAQHSSELPREHGQHDTPADSTTSLSPLVVASTPKLVNLPPARWTEHDDTSTNGLPDPLPSSQSLHANNQSALYSSDSNMSLAYSFPRSHRLRRPARKVPHRAPSASRTGLNRTRRRAGRRGGAHGPQRHISLRNGSQTLGKRQGNSSAFPWRIRHSRKHFKLPLRRRGVFRRRRPSLSRSATHTGPEYRRTTNSSKVEARPRFPIMRRRFRGSVRRERTTKRPFPDEDLETNLNTDAINVSRGEESRSISYPSSNASLGPSGPVKAVPEGAIEAVPPPAIFRSTPGAGNTGTGIPTDSKGHPRRRHRKPGWRRKFYRNRRPFVPGNRDGAKRRPGWRRMRRPLGAAGKKPLPPHSAETTSQNENTQENIVLEKHSLENKQEIASESVTVVSDTTRSTPLLSTTTDRETQMEWPDDAQPASLPPPTPTPGESPETATDAPPTVGETHPRVREAVIPAPTPVPYTVRLWQEHDKKMGGFSSRFVPLSLDIVESDFVPLTHPDATVAEKKPSTDLQHEHREHSEAVHTKEPHHNLQEEPSLVEQPTLVEEPTLLEEPTLVEEPILLEEPTLVEEPSLVAEPTVVEQLTMVEEPTLVEESTLVEQPTIHEVAAVVEQPTLVEETTSGGAPPRQPHSSTTAIADAEIDDLGSHAVVPSAVPHDAQDISPGRAAATQLTSNQTPSTPVSPPVSSATSPSHFPPQPPTDVQLDDHVHAPTDTPSPTQASPDSLLSSNNSRGHGQSSESEGGAPDRPAAADSTRDDLAEAEPQGESGAGTPLLHAAVAGAVLLAVL